MTLGSNGLGESARKSPVRLHYKIIGYVVAWVLALFATDPDAKLWALVWMFPLGLAAVINRHSANSGGWGIFITCIAAYLVQGYFYFRSKTFKWTVLLYGILLIMLFGNIAGCRQMIHVH
jgi:hypothetical protein